MHPTTTPSHPANFGCKQWFPPEPQNPQTAVTNSFSPVPFPLKAPHVAAEDADVALDH